MAKLWKTTSNRNSLLLLTMLTEGCWGSELISLKGNTSHRFPVPAFAKRLLQITVKVNVHEAWSAWSSVCLDRWWQAGAAWRGFNRRRKFPPAPGLWPGIANENPDDQTHAVNFNYVKLSRDSIKTFFVSGICQEQIHFGVKLHLFLPSIGNNYLKGSKSSATVNLLVTLHTAVLLWYSEFLWTEKQTVQKMGCGPSDSLLKYTQSQYRSNNIDTLIKPWFQLRPRNMTFFTCFAHLCSSISSRI